MKNLNLVVTLLPRTTRTGKNIYKVSGNSASLNFYREQQGEYLREEDDGAPLFFTSKLAQSGTLSFNEENERFYLEPDFASRLMLEAARLMFKSTQANSAPAETTEDQEEEQDAEIEAPKAAKPTSGKRSLKNP